MLENLQPAKVFRFFEEICRIPHGSWNERQISDYLLQFARERGLFAVQDEALNIIIKKPGTAGRENCGAVILQGHMDMVCEKNKDTQFDFTTDPLKLQIDGDFISAAGTTLGADNGAAVAMIMALLDADNIAHPPLTAIITTLEEVGCIGAARVADEFVTGKYFINMDGGAEGCFVAGCGGVTMCELQLPCQTRPAEGMTLLLEVTGLKGGHSGLDIDEGRGNALVCLGRILREISRKTPVRIAAIQGGSKDNAIPREAECQIIVPAQYAAEVKEIVGEMTAAFTNELRDADPGITIRLSETPSATLAFSEETGRSVISLLTILPNGVYAHNRRLGRVETSANLAVINGSTAESPLKIAVSVRSNLETKKRFIVGKIEEAARLHGAEFIVKGESHGWEFDPDSRLRQLFCDTYKELRGKDAVVEITHAGMECGIFYEKNPRLDYAAFGSDMFGAHTPQERLSISSMGRSWEFLLNVLQKLD